MPAKKDIQAPGYGLLKMQSLVPGSEALILFCGFMALQAAAKPSLFVSTAQDGDFPLALYAAKTWPEHLEEGNKTAPLVEQQTLRLFRDDAKFENWVDTWDVDRDNYNQKRAGKTPSPVYYASLLGLDRILHELLESTTHGTSESSGVNRQSGEYGNALQAASARGHYAVVQLLLDKEADVHAAGGYFGNALQAASAGGHDHVVQLLLKANANVNATGGEYGSALYAASAQGHESIVQLLLEKNADANGQGGGYGNALFAASARGHEAIVRLLILNGSDVDAQARGYGTALYAASVRGHDAVVKMLLEAGANVDAQGGDYGTPLYAASARGHETIVRLLLERNADVLAGDGFYGDVIQAASLAGHDSIAQLLRKAKSGEQEPSLSETSSQPQAACENEETKSKTVLALDQQVICH